MKRSRMVSWVLQVLVAAVLALMAMGKFIESSQASSLFAQLNMNPGGRYIVGVVELLAVGLLLMPGLATWGAIIAWGVMTGALIAHATSLGLGDPVPLLGVPLGVLAMVNWVAASSIIVLRRRDIGFIRDMCPEEDPSPTKP